MARNRIGLEVAGFEELLEKLEGLNGDTKKAVDDCLKVANTTVAKNVTQAMRRHKRTGATAESIIDHARVEWQGPTASIEVGFNLKHGGMPSIFLMYGTPRMAKDTKLYNAVYGSRTKKEIAEKQAAIFEEVINRRMGG